MAQLSRDEVLKLARLARLHVTDEEVEQLKSEISSILQYVEMLGTVDLDGFAPTNQVTGLVNVMRPDEEVDYTAKPTDLLGNAPATEAGHIKVKRMVDRG